ncbi:MAG: hypothetical protein C5B60_10590, partial [Chloroflexi bacterium]
RLSAADYTWHGIERYCGIKYWYNARWDQVRGKRIRRARLFGLQSDVEMAKYLYQLIQRAIDSEHQHWAKVTLVPGDAHYNRMRGESFRLGMATRIRERLTAMADDLDRTVKTGSGTALVVVKNAVVEDAYATLGLKLRTIGGFGAIRSGAAYADGQRAGDRVNLSRPVQSNGAQRRLS